MLEHRSEASANEDKRRLAELLERFRSESDPQEIERLGEELGRMVFGDTQVLM